MSNVKEYTILSILNTLRKTSSTYHGRWSEGRSNDTENYEGSQLNSIRDDGRHKTKHKVRKSDFVYFLVSSTKYAYKMSFASK